MSHKHMKMANKPINSVLVFSLNRIIYFIGIINPPFPNVVKGPKGLALRSQTFHFYCIWFSYLASIFGFHIWFPYLVSIFGSTFPKGGFGPFLKVD